LIDLASPTLDGPANQVAGVVLTGERPRHDHQQPERDRNRAMHDRRKISGPILAAAAAGLVLLGCGGGGGATGGGSRSPTPRVPPAGPLTEAFVLESSGVPPDDTTTTFAAQAGRVVLLRRGAPDNSLFAEIRIAAADSGATDSTTLAVRPRPGLYGVELSASGRAPGRIRLTFSYGLHFVAPADARERYGSNLVFERTLFVARLEGDRLVYLPSTRPGSDLLSAEVDGPGVYLVASPR